MKKYVLFAILLLSGLVHIQAQNPFVNFTTSEGLPDNTVMGVAIDGQNRPWFATQEGVATYDGTNWTLYTTSNGLIDNYITCIAIAPNGDVWAGTDAGLSRFNGVAWQSYTTQQGLVDNMVTYIAVEAGGVVWVATSGGISGYDGSSFTNYTISNGLPSPMVSYILIDSMNVKWFCTWMGGLVRYDGASFAVFNTTHGLLDNNITCVAIDAQGTKYIGTYYGISVLDAQNIWVRDITSANGLLRDVIQDIQIDSKGNIYMGIFVDYLQEGGISVISGSAIYSYSTVEGLVSAYVDRLAIDQQDNVWIATGNGVSKFLGQYLSMQEEERALTFRCHPNPFMDVLNVEGCCEGAALYRIIDLFGRVVAEEQLFGMEGSLRLDQLASGVYQLQVFQGGETFSQKIIKQ